MRAGCRGRGWRQDRWGSRAVARRQDRGPLPCGRGSGGVTRRPPRRGGGRESRASGQPRRGPEVLRRVLRPAVRVGRPMSRAASLDSPVEAPPDRAATRVPAVRLDNAEVWEAIHDRLRELVLRGRFVLGPEVEEFERLAALTFGCSWAVGVSSGTAALVLALRAAPLRPGARVAIPANTFFATFEAVLLAGHVPVVVDHDERFGISLDELERLAVEAVVPVHLYGLPADMAGLGTLAEDRGWWVIEDCAQAHGASVADRPVGSLGAAGAVSASPTKNVGAWGDAG